jgi:ATP synthase protein I
MELGLTMAGSILFSLLLGYGLDKWLNTKGVFITIFILLGIAGGGYTAYKRIVKATSPTKNTKFENGNGKY